MSRNKSDCDGVTRLMGVINVISVTVLMNVIIAVRVMIVLR